MTMDRVPVRKIAAYYELVRESSAESVRLGWGRNDLVTAALGTLESLDGGFAIGRAHEALAIEIAEQAVDQAISEIARVEW